MPFRYLVRQDWDSVAYAGLCVAFGVYGIVGTPIKNLFAQLGGTMLIFYVEFIAIGVVMLIAMRINSWKLRRLAYGIFALALGMLALLLFWQNRSPFSLLAMAFAMQGVQAVRLLGNQQKVFQLAMDFQNATAKKPDKTS